MQDTQAVAHVTIGILALQGAFAEHQAMLQKLSSKTKVVVMQVRTAEELAACDALVIPGGESTTIALLAKLSGLLEPLREFVRTHPVWGTCAGAILLAQAVANPKQGGQELLGGVSVTIARNGWGSQVESFEAQLEVEGMRNPEVPFTGVFIRAPVILSLLPAPEGQPIRPIARLPAGLLPPALAGGNAEHDQTIVGLRQGHHLLTTFHPELTHDNRFHEYFVQECVVPFVAAQA
ncbi:glutamine amidotransferase subunit pdxT [Dentipellis sp. KUC8613]|nr:glutamine amidotransferase subunit pdxT [Dentipellis sp. KUC8613]